MFCQGSSAFIGRRPRTRDVLQKRMYKTEIEQWIENDAINRAENVALEEELIQSRLIEN